MLSTKILSKCLLIILSLGFYSISFGAEISSFEIISSPTKIKVGESVDITIKALDVNGNIVSDYVGEILIFSQTDPTANFPGILSENTYKFKVSDAGKVKFENGVSFTKSGIQDINVYDIVNEDVFGYTEVEVSEGKIVSNNEEITITSPENGTTLGVDTLKVNGNTIKNHQVKLILNTDQIFEGISDSSGFFEIEIKDIPSGENSLKAEVLDADNGVIGTSTNILFKIKNNTPIFKSIKLIPSYEEFEPETLIKVELQATADLSTVSLILNDIISNLTQKSYGVYTGNITAPKNSGTYKIDVILKNELGLEKKENGIGTITVKEIELNAAGVLEINCDDLQSSLVVSGIKLTKLKTKSILSWDKIDQASSYNVYKKDKITQEMTLIENVSDSKIEINISGDILEYDDFAVKAVLKNDVCNIESSDYSQITKVQTGTKEIFILLFTILLTTGIFILRRKNV